ncbi:PIN-like domain-containing protein [Enterococcus avium]|uniref:PIN-like domain-containing protein n=1 Tax=Enterococcus avium TaxID=33945 RepID=UPI003D1232AA
MFTNELLTMTEDYLAELKKVIDSKVSSMITEEENELYERLISVIENKVGNKYSQKWIDEIEKEGEERYKQNIPPGFNDSSKEDEIDSLRMYGDIKYCRKYGDLIIWKDIIEYSKEYTKMGKKVVFITNDGKAKQKRDLLYKVDDLTVGPNIHLMNELYMESNKELHILNNLRFVQLVNDLSDVEMSKLKKSSEKMYRVKIPHDQIEEERIKLLKKSIENNEYEFGISDDGYLFKKEKNHIDNLYNSAIEDIERKELRKYINMMKHDRIHDRNKEEFYKMYLLNKLTESELKDYKQMELWDKDDHSNRMSYDSKSGKFIFNFDDDLEDNFDNEENE